MADTAELPKVTEKASPAPEISPSYGGDIGTLAKQLAGSSEEAQTELRQTRGAQLKVLDKIVEGEKNRPSPPELIKPEPPPQGHEPPNPIQSWGSLASVLATFGALATRRPLMTALNASASAMNAIRANDTEAYQRHIQEWKQQSEYAAKVNEWQLNRYDLLHDQYKDDQAALMAHYHALAALDQNTSLMHAIKTGDIGLVEKMLQDQRDWGHKLKEFDERVREFNTQQMTPERLATMQFLRQNPKPTTDQWIEFNRQLKSPLFGSYGNPQEVEVTDPDGKKRTVLAQQEKWSGQWVSADAARTPINADSLRLLKGSELGMSGRESVFTQRILTSGLEAARDLENVVQLPIAATTGWLGGGGTATSPYEATRNALANELTSQEVQSYNVMATGFQRSLAAIEASGLAPQGTLTHQMDVLAFKPGDTNLTKLQKLAQIRQIVEAGMSIVKDNSRATDSQRSEAESIIQLLQKSVPYTQSDLLRLQAAQSQNPNVTLKDVMEQKGFRGEGPKPGDVEDGYRFKGGNPADHKNWEKAT